MMGWNSSSLLWLLASMPLWGGVLIWSAKRRMERLKKVGVHAQAATFRVSRVRLFAKEFLLFAAMILLVIAAAGPRWGWRWIESRQMGLDILIAVDVSRSMEAKDLDPSRIERARRLVMDLLDVAEGDRIGLVAFAGDAFVQCPLTNDFGAVRMFLDVLNTDLIPVQGTDMEAALKSGLKALTTGGEGQGKFMLVLSDGEDHNSKLDGALEDVKKAGIKIIAIGMAGTDGAPIPASDGSFKKDRSGNVIISKLDESTLKKLADTTGGMYLRADDSRVRMDRIYREEIRGVGTERETRASKEKVWFERYQWFAGAALLLLLLELCIRDVRRARSLILLSIMAISAGADAAPSALEQYNAAVKNFEDGKVDEAIQGFEAAAQSHDPRLRQRATYNLGNAKSSKGDLEGAKKAWEEALTLDPQDQQARENSGWVRKRIEKKEKEQKKNEQNKDQKNQEQKQDQKDGQKPDETQEGQQNSDHKKDDGSDQNSKKQDQKSGEEQKPEASPSAAPSPSATSSPEPGAKESPVNQDNKGKDGQAQPSAAPMKPGDMKKEDAEKLLRMVPDDLGRFYHPPAAPQKSRTIDQDW